MKKVLSLILAVVMLLSLSLTASATSYNAPGEYSTEVKASYVEGIPAGGTTYSITIEWTGMDSFVYQDAENPVWDPETLEYSETVPASWTGSGTITVTSRSNATLSASPWYEPAAGYSDAHITFDKIGAIVADASVNKQEESVTFTANAVGALPVCDDQTTIGTITLTIKDCSAVSAADENDIADNMAALATTLENYKQNGTAVASPENVETGAQYAITAEVNALQNEAWRISSTSKIGDMTNLEAYGIYDYCTRYGNVILRTK